MIDDVAIEQACAVQVVEWLLDGVCAFRAVGGESRRIVVAQEKQVVVDVGELLARNLIGHEVRKHLLRPHVVEPTHGHKVAEPHMSSLVSDEVQACQLLVGCRILSEEDFVIGELYAARMLHAAELIARQDDKAVFLKRIANVGITFHPVQREGDLVEHLRQLSHLLRIGLAIECR